MLCVQFSSVWLFLKGVNMCESVFNDHHQPVTVPTGVSYVNPRECRSGRIQVGFIGGVVELKAPPVVEEVT